MLSWCGAYRAWLVVGWLGCGAVAAGAEPRRLTFEDDIAPILEARCNKCHGEAQKKGNLDLRRKFTLLEGGDSGPGIDLEKPDDSVFLERILEGSMPPKEEGALDAKQIALLKEWIVTGAHTKAEKEAPLEVQDTVETVTDADRQFWSFVPPQRPEVPTVTAMDRVRTPVDAFLLQRLEAQNLTFNPDADKLVLLRRLTFDLHGLPPTPAQITAFAADTRPDAYERLVDELLASPHYGERWGRHWLDVAGYADSDGYLEADRERPQAWRYRDYVIKALNADKPYDQFLKEQLAGDELYDWRRADTLTPEMQEALVATGFLRTAADPTFEGYKEKIETHKVMADTTHIISSALLGVTLQCARCHAHKSDPFTQRDYYQLHAVLLAAYDPDRWIVSPQRNIPLASEPEQARIAAHNQQIDQRNAELLADAAAFKQTLAEPLVTAKLAPAFDSFAEPLAQAPEALHWSVAQAGTSTGWKTKATEQGLVVEDITGKPGYAITRLTRPVSLGGDFQLEFDFQWNSQDQSPETNTAMQVVLLNLRDAAGNLVVSHGYVDENNNLRGSPVGGIALGGPDVIEHYLKLHKQAAPPDEFARSLTAAGTARITVTRDGQGMIRSTWNDSVKPQELTGQSTARITHLEIEVRRFILTPGATFEGVTLQRLALQVGTGSLIAPEIREQIVAALKLPAEKRDEAQQKLLAEQGPTLVIEDAEFAQRSPEFTPRVEKLKADVAANNAQKQTVLEIRGLADLDDKPAAAKVLRRGDHNLLGAAVEPGVPAVLAPVNYQYAAQPGYKTTGRRLAFANWLIAPEHPLTARVHANRIWAHHFGRGIVPTLDQFGQSGEKPSHPELLDWLATEFIRLGWSQKQFHRLLLTSTAYRQTSDFDAAKAEHDPDNQLWWAWRPVRLEGEAVRDSILQVSGQLQREMFGPPVGVVSLGDGQVVAEQSPAGMRRSVYLKVRRSQPLTLLELFDTPRMEINCTQRTEAIVATQALTLSNSKFMETSAVTLAGHLAVTAGSEDPSRAELAWTTLLGRPPTATEQRFVAEFLDRVVQSVLGDQFATATPEQLRAARETAWVQVALALFNSNEFLFVH